MTFRSELSMHARELFGSNLHTRASARVLDAHSRPLVKGEANRVWHIPPLLRLSNGPAVQRGQARARPGG